MVVRTGQRQCARSAELIHQISPGGVIGAAATGTIGRTRKRRQPVSRRASWRQMKSRQTVIAVGLVSACLPVWPVSCLSCDPSTSKRASWPSLGIAQTPVQSRPLPKTELAEDHATKSTAHGGRQGEAEPGTHGHPQVWHQPGRQAHEYPRHEWTGAVPPRTSRQAYAPTPQPRSDQRPYKTRWGTPECHQALNRPRPPSPAAGAWAGNQS